MFVVPDATVISVKIIGSLKDRPTVLTQLITFPVEDVDVTAIFNALVVVDIVNVSSSITVVT